MKYEDCEAERIENMDEECTKDLTRSNNRIKFLSNTSKISCYNCGSLFIELKAKPWSVVFLPRIPYCTYNTLLCEDFLNLWESKK
jgi:hypothetical protein